MNIDKGSLVFNGFSNYSWFNHWSVSTAWIVSLNSSSRTSTKCRWSRWALLLPFMSAAKKMLGHLLNESAEALLVPYHSASLLVAARNNPAHVPPVQRQPSAACQIAHQTAICLPMLLDGLGSSVGRQGLWERLRAWKTRLHNFVQNRPRMPICFWILWHRE